MILKGFSHNYNLSQSAICSFCLVGEGSGSQEWGSYMLLISIPADFTTRIHSLTLTKIMIPVDLASGPESGGTAVAGVEWKGLVAKMIQ